jgi:hypothetical protein
VIAGFLAVTLGGCGLTRSPSARIASAALVDRSTEALRFDVAAELTNPNPEDSLELRTIRYTVRIDGGGTYRGLRAAQATLAPGADATLQLPVIVPLDRIDPAATALDWSIDGVLLYIAPGALAETLLDAGVRRPTIRFRGEGRVVLVAGDGGSILPAGPLVGPEPQDTD